MEVMIMQKCLIRLFISFLLVLIGPVQAEYLVFKKLGMKIVLPSRSEHKNKIYPILMRFQFPMNQSLATGDCECLFIENKLKELDPSYRVVFVPTTLYELFMVEKYTDRSNDLWAELLLSGYHLKDLKKREYVEEFFKWCFSNPIESSIPEDERKKIVAEFVKIRNYSSSEKERKAKEIIKKYTHPLSVMGCLHQGKEGYLRPSINIECKIGKEINYDFINKHEDVIETHYTVNKELGAFVLPFLEKKNLWKVFLRLDADDLQFPLCSARELVQSLLIKIIQNIRKTTPIVTESIYNLLTKEEKENYEFAFGARPIKWYRFKGYYPFNFEAYKAYHHFLTDKTTSFILSVIDDEYESEHKNKFNLYRGELRQVNEESRFMEMIIDGVPRSLSFGTSLFAGFIHDLGACVFDYACKRPIFYGVGFNKSWDVHEKDFIVISRYNTVVSFAFGEGEFFHARTKFPRLVAREKEHRDPGKIVAGMWLEEKGTIDPHFSFMIENVENIYGVKKTAPELYFPLISFIKKNIFFITDQSIEKLTDLICQEREFWHGQLPIDQSEAIQEDTQLSFVSRLLSYINLKKS